MVCCTVVPRLAGRTAKTSSLHLQWIGYSYSKSNWVFDTASKQPTACACGPRALLKAGIITGGHNNKLASITHAISIILWAEQ